MNMSNIYDRMVKSVNIKQEWNEVNDVTTEIRIVNTPTHPSFVILSVTQDIHDRITKKSLASKCMISLKLSEDTILFTNKKVMWMESGTLMSRYKTDIYPFTKYHQPKATFYTYPLCVKVPSL